MMDEQKDFKIAQISKYYMQLLCVLPIGLIMGSVFLWEWYAVQPSNDDQLLSGKIVEETIGKHLDHIERPALIIRIDDTDIMVKAILSMNGKGWRRDKVTFYYSGDPKKEIYLLEETNPKWIGLFFLLSLILGLIFVKCYELKVKSG